MKRTHGELSSRDLARIRLQRALDNRLFPEPKRQFAFRWLGDQTIARRKRENRTFKYVRWTFWAAIAAVVVGAVFH